MTTPRDLVILALDAALDRPPRQGDLSLALAGAELADLLAARSVRLDDERIMPDRPTTTTDPLLDRAASSLLRQPPYESVDDWLWRRGRGLATAYLTAMEAEGQLTRRRRHRTPFGAGELVPADTPERRAATERWASHELVLSVLAVAAGIGDTRAQEEPTGVEDSVLTVLAAVDGAVRELEAVRQRRAIEDAAFDNVWRGAG
ncbi:GPP34 family phosphoprotein [Kitasatospora sp. NPDC057015]|uniref:GOLPH3/VPS74 family protein n=1 Tax=Kitasatospora sp. NPDC057015 TaxID=3346001 RepID=UPI00362CA96A